MPNWCSNTVTVEGEAEEIRRFIDYVKDASGESAFSFHAIMPMPEELRGTCSPASIVTQEEYTNYETPSHGFDVGKPITQEMSDRFMEQYGVNDWYAWASQHWGTKWDVDADAIQEVLDLTHVRYRFDTAWGPPDGIYEELVNQFPMLNINWFYEEENMEVVGNLATDNPTNKQSVKEVNKQIFDLLGRIKY